jgi:hypothetical protein
MSDVTNIILSFSVAEIESSRINEINTFANNGRGFNLVSADFEEGRNFMGRENRNRWYGGSKMLETPLFVGAFNNLDINGLVEHLRSLNWEEPENVQLIVQEQHEYKFKIIEII